MFFRKLGKVLITDDAYLKVENILFVKPCIIVQRKKFSEIFVFIIFNGIQAGYVPYTFIIFFGKISALKFYKLGSYKEKQCSAHIHANFLTLKQ